MIALGDVRPSHPVPNVRDDREPPLLWKRDKQNEATDLGVRSIAAGRDRLARRANYADEACTFASHHHSSFRGDAPPELGFTRVRLSHLSKSATADLDGRARNPFNR